MVKYFYSQCLSLVMLFVFISSNASAQKNKDEIKSTVIICSEFHITRPLRDIVADNVIDESKNINDENFDDHENRKAQRFRFSVNDGPEYGNAPSSIQKTMGVVPGRAPITNWPG